MPPMKWDDPVPSDRRPESDPRVSLFEIRCVPPKNPRAFSGVGCTGSADIYIYMFFWPLNLKA